MKVTKQESLYYKDHGATLKHKRGKRIVRLSLLSFSHIFLFVFLFFFFWVGFFGPLFYLGFFGLSFFYFFYFFHGAMLYNDDHHTLFTYNSILQLDI